MERFRVVPAVYVVILRDGPDGSVEVLLQLRSGTGYMDDHWACAAAGHVERGESVVQAAVREAAEELGIDVEAADLIPLCGMHRTAGDGNDSTSAAISSSRCVAGPVRRTSVSHARRQTCAGSRYRTCRTRWCRTSSLCWRLCVPAPCRRSSRSASVIQP